MCNGGNEMELWDAYDLSLRKIEGKELVRGKPVPEGCYHLVSDVIVRHADGTYLLMQRDPKKKFGGLWEMTRGGSALKGESAEDCRKRELEEETGIVADSFELLGIMTSEKYRTIYVEFIVETDWDKGNIVMQKGETVDYRWVGAKEIARMKKDELLTDRMQPYLNELRP